MSDMTIGPFLLETPIAEGGMGEVWRGLHRPTATPVAVKILTGRTTQRPRFRQTFRNEARAMSGLAHPNIAQIYDYGEVEANSVAGRRFGNRCPYLVMEYVPSSVAQSAIVSDWTSLKRLLLDLLDALAHAHARGVIHRDLKPNNLLVNQTGSLKLSDFGIAFTTDHAGVDVEQLRAAGTPEYMAPEQCHGMWRDFGPWTDLYGVGCVIHAVLNGEPPFVEDHPMGTMLAKLEREPPLLEPHFDVPQGFTQWVHRLLKRTPSQRFQRSADAAWALRALAFPEEVASTSMGDHSSMDSVSDFSVHDTVIGGGFDTMIGFEKLDMYNVAPNFEGSSTGLFRANRAPIAVEWRGSERTSVPPLIDAGLELYSLRKTRIVGREEVRDVLWNALRTVHTESEPRCVLLRGPAGVGKSRSVQWLCERAHEAGVATILHAHHAADPGPANGLAPMLLRHLRCAGLPRSDIKHRLSAMLDDPSVVDPDGINALTEFIMPAQFDDATESDHTVRFFSLVERHLVLAKHLEHLALERTVILWLDDVHWGYESLDFVQWLLTRRRCAFLVLMTASQGMLSQRKVESAVIDDLLKLDIVKAVDVEPLPPEEHSALVKGLLYLDPGLAHRVEERTSGNPLFAIHLVQDWISRRLLIPSDTGYTLKAGAPTELPTDLSAVWSGRVERFLNSLTIDDTQAIELAATLGQEVNPDEWSALCRLAGLNVSPDLTITLTKNGFITFLDEKNPEGGWTFVHAMLREAIERYANDQGRRASHHKMCVALLRSQAQFDLRIPRHLCASGQLVEALKPFRQLVHVHLASGDHRAAAAVLLDWRSALKRLGDNPRSKRWLETDLVENNISSLRGELIKADVGIDTLIRRLNPSEDVGLICRALIHRGRIANEQGRYREAIIHLETAIKGLNLETATRSWGWSHWYLGVARGSLGQYDESMAAFSESENAFLSLDDMVHASLCLLGRTRVAQHRGDRDEAAKLIESAGHELGRAGARAGVAATIHARAELLRMSGDLEGSEALYRQAQDRYAAIGSSHVVRVELDLSSVLLERQAFLESQLILERVLTSATNQGRRVLSAQAYINLLVCDAHRRDWHAWDTHLAGATELLAATQVVGLDFALNAGKAGQLAAAAGHYERAYACFVIAQHQWKKMKREQNVADIESRMTSLKTTLNG